MWLLVDFDLEKLATMYLSRAYGTAIDYCPLQWWKLNSVHLPMWSKVARKILLVQPPSAAVERVFSILNSSFKSQQNNALQDYIEASVMLQVNRRAI